MIKCFIIDDENLNTTLWCYVMIVFGQGYEAGCWANPGSMRWVNGSGSWLYEALGTFRRSRTSGAGGRCSHFRNDKKEIDSHQIWHPNHQPGWHCNQSECWTNPFIAFPSGRRIRRSFLPHRPHHRQSNHRQNMTSGIETVVNSPKFEWCCLVPQ